MKAHPAAELFPLMDDEALAGLAADIKENGLRVPIALAQGRILDGRNRFAACALAGVEPEFVEVRTGSPVAYVVSHNLKRRQLSPNQAAMVAAKVEPMLAEEAKGRAGGRPRKDEKPPAKLPGVSGDARDQAAKLTGVSGRSVSHAKNVLAKGSADLVRAVESGDIAVSDAAKVLGRDKAEQTALLRKVQAGEAKTLAGAARDEARAYFGKGEEPGDKSLTRFAGAIKRLAAMAPEVTSLATAAAAVWEETGAEVEPGLASGALFISITAMRDALSRVVAIKTMST